MKRIRKIIKQRLFRVRQMVANTRSEISHYDSHVVRLDDICDTWESVNLNPSLIIYRNHCKYLLSIIHIASSGQASPSTYEIQSDDNGYFITPGGRRVALSCDHLRDEILLEGYGNYLRN